MTLILGQSKPVPPVRLNHSRGSKSALQTAVTALIQSSFELHLGVVPVSSKILLCSIIRHHIARCGSGACSRSWVLRRFTNVCHLSSSVGKQTCPSMPLVVFKTAGHNCLIAIKIKATDQCVQSKLTLHCCSTSLRSGRSLGTRDLN